MINILTTRTIYQGWLNLLLVDMRAADGTLFTRHVVDMKRAVSLLPYDPDRRTALLVSMPRTPVMLAGLPDMLEAIAGVLEDEPADCARREALEEAGVRLGDLHHIGQIWSIPAVTSEKIDYFLAEYRAGDRVEAGGGLIDEQENITVHELTLDDLWTRLANKEIADGKLAILLMALRLRRPDLFSVPVG
jgi:nudix-type nucleoside diphosphatase (YffH/AdpP family)